MERLKNKKNIITYTVDKAINNNLYISVQNGEVVVKAPWYFTGNQIQKIVEEKKKWILAKLKEYENNKNINSNIKIYGKKYEMKITYKNINIPKLDVDNMEIKVQLPNSYKNFNNREILEMLLNKMYDSIANQELENIMEKVRITLGFAPEDYEIIRMDKIMGKCTDNKKIIINPDIVKYKKETIEYIILHEFCHLKYKTHSKKFNEIIKNYNLKNVDFKELNEIKF